MDTGEGCQDTDHGVFDTYGDNCTWYYGLTSGCGNYDDDDFTANTMCCACKGIITIYIHRQHNKILIFAMFSFNIPNWKRFQ